MMGPLKKVGGLSRLSSSLMTGTLFSLPTPQPSAEGWVSNVALESILRASLLKLLKAVSGRKYRHVTEEATKQLDLLEQLVAQYAEKQEDKTTTATTEAALSIKTSSTGGDTTDIEPAPASPAVMPSEPLRLWVVLKFHATEFFRPFQLACETKSARVTLVALDCIQKLLACGFLSDGQRRLNSIPAAEGTPDDKPPLSDEPELLLVDRTVDTVIQCINIQDEAVQLQVIRCLLTAVTSNLCEDLHGEALTSAVQAGFRIYANSRDPQNQRTARAALTQIVNTVVRRLQSKGRRENGFLPPPPPPSTTASLQTTQQTAGNVLVSCMAPSASRTLADTETLPEGTEKAEALGNAKGSEYKDRDGNGILAVDTTVVSELAPTVASFDEDSASSGAPTAGQAAATIEFGPDTSTVVPCSDTAEADGRYGRCVVCDRPAAECCPESGAPVCSGRCRDRHVIMIQSVDQPVADKGPIRSDSAQLQHGAVTLTKSLDGGEHESGGTHDLRDGPLENTDAVYRHDALLVFQTLCKLSMQEATGGQTTDQSVVRVKRLSLELLLSMLQSSGTTFRLDMRFIQSIRSLLCISLIKNCVSHIPRIFGLSLSIFLVLAVNFKDYLRTEIGVFVDQILLRILESGNCSFEHKHRVLQVFRCLCTDAKVSLELYLNFDCDVEEKDVLANTVDCLAKIAQGKYTSVDRAAVMMPEQQYTLQCMALEALVTLVTSLLVWVRKSQRELDRRERERERQAELLEATTAQKSECLSSGPEGHLSPHESLAVNVVGPSDGESDGKTPSSVVRPPPPPPVNQHEHMIQQRKRKLQFQEGVSLFNVKPKRGLEFLIERGYIKDTPESIATFFLRSSGLDKQVIGEYLGEDKPFNQEVLYQLVDQLDFTNQEIDTALRHFLTTFRLPGEAQKIDRMMEKFAEKYIKDNPGKFATADCAYVLAFSLIMLHTDAHSRSIKPENKMTMEMFVRNNRGINDNQDLPTSYLEELYNRIVAEEWVMEEDRGNREALEAQPVHQLEGLTVALGLALPTASRRKFELFLKESKGMVKKTTEMIQRRGRERFDEAVTGDMKNGTGHLREADGHYVVASIDLAGQVRFLFESIYMALLATLSVLIQSNQDDPTMTRLLLQGFQTCTHLASHFELYSEVELFVSSLTKFTGVTFASNPAEVLLTERNVQCIRTLLDIALSEGNALGSTWKAVLECVSRLHRLQMTNLGCSDDVVLPHSLPAETSSSQLPFPDDCQPDTTHVTRPSSGSRHRPYQRTSLKQQASQDAQQQRDTASQADTLTDVEVGSSQTPTIVPHPPDSDASQDTLIPLTIEQLNAALVVQEIDTAQIDLLFMRSTSLASTAIVQFVSALCEVSRQELAASSPRIFSLQKLVEVADHNMNRIRLIWTKIWAVLREHFVEAASHRNIGVCLYAVDSLRQLAMKFLEKDELSNYSFQVEFLKPLHVVMKNPESAEEVREFIVQVISNMIQAQAHNIKSGWKSVFHILNSAAVLPDVVAPAGLTGVDPTLLHARRMRAFARARQAFDVVTLVLRKHFWTAVDYLGEVVRCLVTFGLLRPSSNAMETEKALVTAIEALRYLEGTAVVLADEDYQAYLLEGYHDCDKVVLMEGGLPHPARSNNTSEMPNHATTPPNASLDDLCRSDDYKRQGMFEGVARRSTAEQYIKVLWRCRDAQKALNDYTASQQQTQEFSSEDDVRKRELEFELEKAHQERQLQLSGCWFPVFTGLTQLSTAPAAMPVVREAALDALFRLLMTIGHRHLNRDMWQMTLRGVLFPLFDDLHLHLHIQHQDQPQLPVNVTSSSGLSKQSMHDSERPHPLPSQPEDSAAPVSPPPPPDGQPNDLRVQWAASRCWAALVHLVDLSYKRFDCIRYFLNEVLALIVSCIEGQPEAVGRLGVEALKDFITRVGPRCEAEDWVKISKCLTSVFRRTSPEDLILRAPPLHTSPVSTPNHGGGGSTEGEQKGGGTCRRVETSGSTATGSLRSGHDHGKDELLRSSVHRSERRGGDTNHESATPPNSVDAVRSLPFKPVEIVTQCVIQLHLISLVHQTFPDMIEKIPAESVDEILLTLKDAFLLARRFNRRVDWRCRLKSLGFMREMRQLPGLLKQERESLCTLVDLSLKLIASTSDVSSTTDVRSPLDRPQFFLDLLKTVIDQYLEHQPSSLQATAASSETPKPFVQLQQVEAEREIAGMTPILIRNVLGGLESLPDPAFQAMSPALFQLLTQLILCDSKTLRAAVQQLMLRRFLPFIQRASQQLS